MNQLLLDNSYKTMKKPVVKEIPKSRSLSTVYHLHTYLLFYCLNTYTTVDELKYCLVCRKDLTSIKFDIQVGHVFQCDT